jgi:hypothetical protein
MKVRQTHLMQYSVRRMGQAGSRHRKVLVTGFDRPTEQIWAASTGILLVTGNDPY